MQEQPSSRSETKLFTARCWTHKGAMLSGLGSGGYRREIQSLFQVYKAITFRAFRCDEGISPKRSCVCMAWENGICGLTRFFVYSGYKYQTKMVSDRGNGILHLQSSGHAQNKLITFIQQTFLSICKFNIDALEDMVLIRN